VGSGLDGRIILREEGSSTPLLFLLQAEGRIKGLEIIFATSFYCASLILTNVRELFFITPAVDKTLTFTSGCYYS
jgi:hypothetical protein